MGKVKKEHYVPQCYLRNFRITGEDYKINVFDKKKPEVRIFQNIEDVASERYFYDIKIDKILEELPESERDKLIAQMGDQYEFYKNDDKQHIEKFFSKIIEGNYSNVLKSIIEKAEGSNAWCIKNCFCMSQQEKEIMALFISLQFWRTKKQREMLKEGLTKISKTLLCKIYNVEYGDTDGKISEDDIETAIGKESMKLQHAKFMFDKDRIKEFTQIFQNHLWVIYINRTKVPFWTSDSPIVLNNGTGIASKGIEIIFPLSDKVALGMYDRKMYSEIFSEIFTRDDRIYIELKKEEIVLDYNKLQVSECYRCVYSSNSDFSVAEKMCKDNPKLMEDTEYFTVG